MKKQILTIALVALATAASYAQGRIQLANSVGTPVRIDSNNNGTYETSDRLATAADALTVEIWFANPGEQLTMASVVGRVGANGVIGVADPNIDVRNVPIVGTSPDTTISLQIRAHNADNTLFGQTAVKQVTVLGAGQVIWQGITGTAPDRFTPLLVQVVPEPSTIALGVLGLGSLLLFRRRK